MVSESSPQKHEDLAPTAEPRSNAEEGDTLGFLVLERQKKKDPGPCWPANPDYSLNSRPVRDPASKRKVGGTRVDLWPPHQIV